MLRCMAKRRSRYLDTGMVLASGFFLSCSLGAGAEVTVSAGAHTGMLDFKIDDTSYRPWIGGIQGALQLENGIGAELALATGITDDEKSNTELSLDLGAQGYLTYSMSDEFSSLRQSRLTVGAGYVFFDTSTDAGGTGYPGGQSWDGAGLLIRYSESLPSLPQIILSGSYEHFYLDDRLSVAQYKLGVSYEF